MAKPAAQLVPVSRSSAAVRRARMASGREISGEMPARGTSPGAHQAGDRAPLALASELGGRAQRHGFPLVERDEDPAASFVPPSSWRPIDREPASCRFCSAVATRAYPISATPRDREAEQRKQ